MSGSFETPKETLKERTEVLFKNGELTDCVFIVGENEVTITAHKIFLAISSPVFYAMFHGDIAEKSNTVKIKDIDPSAFKGMLQYIYTDKVDFESSGHACMVYLAAKKYLLPYLEAQCEFYIESNVNALTACEIYEFAKFHNISNVENICLKYFQNDTEEILRSQSFIESEYSTVLSIVKTENLNISSELVLFEAVEKWAMNEAARRGVSLEFLSNEMTEIISNLRFLSLTADEFTASQVNKTQDLIPLLTTEEKLAIVMNITHPGITPLPKRLSTITVPRKPRIPDKFIEEEWSLCRDCHESALFPVTKWCNPFTRIGITVSRRIKVKGVKISTQKKTNSTIDDVYQEKMTVVIKKDWSLKFFGSLYHNIVQYNSEVEANFSKPVQLDPGKLYWLIVNFDKGGTYTFLKDVNHVYNSHNMEIKMTEDLSAITEIFFIENELSDGIAATFTPPNTPNGSTVPRQAVSAPALVTADAVPSSSSQRTYEMNTYNTSSTSFVPPSPTRK
ncbi:BTB/POZ domain-containing protein 6-like [Lycorma delicatula]|uniref:BTB/POZ domain-containing protein 6-like n=1 Tax=Lycorma delicatula TaxID=130591 RepID=UPI003F50F930